jgi:hypothetical protein
MSKKMRNRSAPKVKKPPAAPPPVEAKKAPEGIHAQQDAHSAPLPSPPPIWGHHGPTAQP